MTFGKVMGGGFPAAAFGGRADVMSQLAPRGAGLPGRHAVREPDRHHRRPGHAAAGDRRGLRPPRPPPATRSRPPPPRRSPTAGVPHVVQSAGTMFSVFFTDGPGARLRRRRAHRHWRRTPRSSTPCSTTASTCRRRRTRRGSCPPPTTTARCRPCSTPCPAPPAAAARRRRSHERPPTPIVHLLRHGEVHNPEGVLYGRRDGFHLSELGRQMAERVADAIRDRDIVHLRVLAARARPGDRRAAGRWRAGSRSSLDERVIESANKFEGGAFGRRRQRAAQPAALAAPLQPVQAVVGRALQGDRRAG